jgi:hypothetical protein
VHARSGLRYVFANLRMQQLFVTRGRRQLENGCAGRDG